MVSVVARKIKGKNYLYLEETVRMGKDVRKIYQYLGPSRAVKQPQIEEAKTLFQRELLTKKVHLKVLHFQKTMKRFEYPLTDDEIKKIELMNFKYHLLMKRLHPKDLEDLNKRFIANYVFESNALEGNSLTLKNIAEIIFEKRIGQGKDLREIYDAQNSYYTFLFLQQTRKKIDHDFIISLHKQLMHKIDDRMGYRTLPAVIIGKHGALTKPEEIPKAMDALLAWYYEQQEKLYPLELAFKFHAQFEKIHPFSDGNGRTGRLLLNYILMQKGYFPIILRSTRRNQYLKSLDAADRGIWLPLMRFALRYYKDTFTKFFEVYSNHLVTTT